MSWASPHSAAAAAYLPAATMASTAVRYVAASGSAVTRCEAPEQSQEFVNSRPVRTETARVLDETHCLHHASLLRLTLHSGLTDAYHNLVSEHEKPQHDNRRLATGCIRREVFSGSDHMLYAPVICECRNSGRADAGSTRKWLVINVSAMLPSTSMRPDSTKTQMSGPPHRLHVLDQGQEEVGLAALGQRLHHAVQRLRARRHPAVLHALQRTTVQDIVTQPGAKPFLCDWCPN